MVFGIVILLIVGVVAYFHYVQGLFSATLSAICAVFAAIISVSFTETVINSLLKGAMADDAQSMVLVALFALVYIILRVIFDKTIPGNVMFPLMVDKVGAAVMGIIAGLFAGGVFAMAAESLPFGPSIAMYARFPTANHEAVIPGVNGQQHDGATFDEMKDPSLDPSKAKGMLVPADDLLVGAVGQVSTGALSNDHPLAAVHPDWITELFGQRAGVQIGAKHVALNLPGLQMVSLKDVFRLDAVPQIDAEHKTVRTGRDAHQDVLVTEKDKVCKPPPDETLLVVRVGFDSNASDEDNKVRVSTAAVRLVGWHEKSGTTVYTNYTPLGTLEAANVLYRNKPDDPLVLPGGKSADFVFQVPREDVFKEAAAKNAPLEIKSNVFVEVKRMARLDLSGHAVTGRPTVDADVQVLRKPLPQAENLPTLAAGAAPTAANAGGPPSPSDSPIEVATVTLSDKLFSKINTGNYTEGSSVAFRSGNATMKNKKFQKLLVNDTDTLKLLEQGDFANEDLYVPDGKKMVQVSGKPPAKGGDPWQWATQLGKFELVDSAGVKYRPNGGFAKVTQTGQNKMAADYDADATVQLLTKEDGRPSQVWIVFNVPAGTQITQVNFNGKPIKPVSLTAQ